MNSQLLAIHGGTPVRQRHWPRFDKGDVDVNEREMEAARRVLGKKLLFRYDTRGMGETEVGCFEKALQDYFGVKHALAVSSGTAALTVSLMAIGVKPGDEVLCSAFAFAADPSSIILAGATPVLVEVDKEMHIDIADLEKRITPKTRAILVVHQRGQAGPMEPLLQIAKKYGLPLVEDAVPALGAKIGNQYLGTFGTFGAFSTQADKSLNTGEGGFLLTNDTLLFERAVLLSGAYETRVHKHCTWPLSIRCSTSAWTNCAAHWGRFSWRNCPSGSAPWRETMRVSSSFSAPIQTSGFANPTFLKPPSATTSFSSSKARPQKTLTGRQRH